jgi:shikimate kinase
VSPARGIALIGAPGAGKTTVGRRLAHTLELPFVDVDALIEARFEAPLREVFAEHGESGFRAVERTATLGALTGPGVVAVGGGAVLDAEVASALRGWCVVWLQVSATQATRRLGLNQAGGLVLGNIRGRLIQQLAERQAVYERLATITVDTDRSEVAAVVERIVRKLPEEDR